MTRVTYYMFSHGVDVQTPTMLADSGWEMMYHQNQVATRKKTMDKVADVLRARGVGTTAFDESLRDVINDSNTFILEFSKGVTLLTVTLCGVINVVTVALVLSSVVTVGATSPILTYGFFWDISDLETPILDIPRGALGSINV